MNLTSHQVTVPSVAVQNMQGEVMLQVSSLMPTSLVSRNLFLRIPGICLIFLGFLEGEHVIFSMEVVNPPQNSLANCEGKMDGQNLNSAIILFDMNEYTYSLFKVFSWILSICCTRLFGGCTINHLLETHEVAYLPKA